MARKKFNLGKKVMTRGVANQVAEDLLFSQFVLTSLARHACGDWGEVDEEDQKANDWSLKNGERLLSAYTLNGRRRKIWIITERDRSVTTILFPEEY